jgi:hypothetical protein
MIAHLLEHERIPCAGSGQRGLSSQIEPSHRGIVWRLYSARISVLYSLGFVVAGTPAFAGEATPDFRGGQHLSA